jgi:hypothetical protein
VRLDPEKTVYIREEPLADLERLFEGRLSEALLQFHTNRFWKQVQDIEIVSSPDGWSMPLAFHPDAKISRWVDSEALRETLEQGLKSNPELPITDGIVGGMMRIRRYVIGILAATPDHPYHPDPEDENEVLRAIRLSGDPTALAAFREFMAQQPSMPPGMVEAIRRGGDPSALAGLHRFMRRERPIPQEPGELGAERPLGDDPSHPGKPPDAAEPQMGRVLWVAPPWSQFVRRLAEGSPDSWIQITLNVPAEEYEVESKSGREALRRRSANPDSVELSTLIDRVLREANKEFEGSFPPIAALREHQPFASLPEPLTERQYALLRESASRRAVPATLALALMDGLSPAELYGVYRPFQVAIPLATLGVDIQGKGT